MKSDSFSAPGFVACNFAILLFGFTLLNGLAADSTHPGLADVEKAQVPSWSSADREFFLHGSMSTEIVPENVLRAFIVTYPDMFPTRDLSHLGLIPDPDFGWPVGFSRKPVPHLGGLPSVGINCAACHVAEVTSDSVRGRVLGATSHFDSEAFFGSIIAATFRTGTEENLKKFLGIYLSLNAGAPNEDALKTFEAQWQQQQEKIASIMVVDPVGARGIYPGGLNDISPENVQLNPTNVATADLAALSHSMLKLFDNIRVALHFPDRPPDNLPPPSGPGRNDAFGALSLSLFGTLQQYAPVKYGLVWNLDKRHWVDWDGNTQSPIGRNLLAAVGLGAPLIDKHALLDFALLKRQTELSEKILAPRYPFAIDDDLARRGAARYQAKCATCHDGPETDARLYSPAEIGTQPLRAKLFTQASADRFNGFLAELKIPGYQPSSEPGIQSTQKYFAPSLAGVWARSPYLHNGSVRTIQELLTAPAMRAKSFHRGSREYDPERMGYTDGGVYVFQSRLGADTNAGHDYGTDLTPGEMLELMEYLKTL